MNINLKFLLIGTSLSLIPNLLYAQCVPAQSCAELGYKETANKGGCLKCPFGNGWYCPQKPCDASYQYTCTGTNEQPGTDNCGGKYKSCTCASGYEWKDGKCQIKGAILGQCTGYAKNCAIGQILNSDGTCTTNKESDKTPIGVIVYIGSDNCGYAMTASPIASSIKWSTVRASTGVLMTRYWEEAIKDFDVSGNMTKIIQAGSSNNYPAAYAALNYAPSAAPISKGKWMLPTAGILNSLYNNLNAINNAISKVGGRQLTNDNEHIWSSSEYKYDIAWVFCTDYGANNGGVYGYGKSINTNNFVVRPVIAF
mgnify:CR=1 FL=1